MMNNSGNALFLILIAVALFAALSYAVTQTTRGSGTIDREEDLILASKMNQIIANIRAGVTRLRVLGCPEENISLYSDQYSSPSSYDNANTPVGSGDFSCHVFNDLGAGLTYFGEDMGDSVCEDGNCGSTLMKASGDFAVQGLGSSAAELIYIVDNTDEVFCNAINRSVGIDGIPTDTANPDDGATWQGTFDDASPEIIGDSDAALAGHDIGCYDRSGSEYVFYAVVMER